jgi:hypothetical protein
MVLVDSSVWIEAFRRNGEVNVKLALKGLLDEFEAAWCSIVKLEVMGGARVDERAMMVRRFETIPYLQVTEKDWEWAVSASWRLQEKGHVVKSTDLLVAAVAERRGIRVFARDKHFDVMRDVLGIALYTPGYNGMYNPGTE